MTTEHKAAGADNPYSSEHQRTSDRAGMTYGASSSGAISRRDLSSKASDMADDAADKAWDAGDTLMDKARDAGETMMDKASDVGHYLQETGHNITEKSKHTHQVVCDFTKRHPTAVVLTAFALGAILGRLLPGR